MICDAPQISLHLPIRKATAEVIEPNKAGAAFVCWMLFRCSVVSNSCDPMDYSPPGFSAQEISQARILEWVAICFSRGSSQARDRTHVSCIGRQILYHRATMEALCVFTQCLKLYLCFQFILKLVESKCPSSCFVFFNLFSCSRS